MTENKIYVRFQSEKDFEEFKFSGENISYKEVLIDYLAKKKKLTIPTEKEKLVHPDKTDKIQLVNLSKGNEEINDEAGGGMIEANTHIQVRRVPFKDYKPIEASYNKVNNALTKIKNQRRLGLQKGASIQSLYDGDSSDESMDAE